MSAVITAPISDADRYKAVRAFDRRSFENSPRVQNATAEERAELIAGWDENYDRAADMMAWEMVGAK